jgi:hypothetical protein
MAMTTTKEKRILELVLIVIVVGMACLYFKMGAQRIIVLNLFYLPIVLSGYYLGRLNTGVLALFCSLVVILVSTSDSAGFAAFDSPILVYLALAVWAAVLGLTAIIVGTLCDERAATVNELQEAYVGVVEVLSKYLQTGDTTGNADSNSVVKLSQDVASDLRLSRKDVDDIRVGVLLSDLGNVEITTRLINKAISTLESGPESLKKRTFLGMELVQSLGSVLHDAVPLLADQNECGGSGLAMEDDLKCYDSPLGVRIIRTVRAYAERTTGKAGRPGLTPEEALAELRNDSDREHDQAVVEALARVVRRRAPAPAEPALVS